MKTRNLAVAVILALAGAAPAAAIELSLEENRAERGNIGYVDTQRLFKLFPETLKAKENFEEAVRQAEDQINLRKAEMLRLRKELDALKVERASIARSTPTAPAPVVPPAPAPVKVIPAAAPVSTAAAVAPAAAASTAAVAAYEQVLKPIVSPQAPVAQLPGFPAPAARPMTSTAAVAQPLIINLPGATTGPVVIAPPMKEPPVAPAPAVVAAPPPTAVPAAPPVAIIPAVSTAAAQAVLDASLASLDEQIRQKTAELARKEAQAREEQEAAEKSLLDLESRKSEILLGKIYKAVQEVARREGVSVVVDKTGILYGHNAVDLTEKVLKYLKGA